MLLKRIPKKPRRSERWRSQGHCNHVRKHACVNCGTVTAIEVAHVRIGSQAGMSRKPDDWRTVPLCKPCHQEQHTGERTFWAGYATLKGHTVEDVIAELIRTSPKRLEIEQVRKERGI